MSTSKNQVGLKETIAILSLYFISMGFTVVTPAMAKLAAAFPDNNFSLISTLPTLFVVFATLWAGTVAGKKVKYRTLALTGCIIFTVSGTLPAIVGGSFAFILVTRALVGIGLGLMAPLGNALIIGLYEGQKQAAYLGYGTLLMNGGGIVLQMLGGALADMGWKTTFFGHLLGIISIVCLIFLPEPAKAPVQPETNGKPAAKDKISPFVYAIAILFLLFNVLNYPVMLNMSLMFEMKGAGGATMAATALSLYTVAGCVAGFLFGTIFKMMKRFCLPIAFFLWAIGAYCIYIGKTMAVMSAGTILIGFAFSVIMPAAFTLVGMRTPPSTVAIGTSIIMALMNLGGFLSSFWLSLLKTICGENIYSPLLVETVIIAVLGVVFLIYNPFPKQPEQ